MSSVLQVTTDQADLPPDRQAKQKMTAEAYKSQGNSGNFLHLAVGASEVQPGDNLPVNFHLKSNNDGVRKSVSYFTYLVGTAGFCHPSDPVPGLWVSEHPPTLGTPPHGLLSPTADPEQGAHRPRGEAATRR